MGKTQEAKAAYQRCVSLDTTHADAHNSLGRLLQLAGDLEGAEASYRAALAAQPGHAYAHYNLGLILNQVQRHTEALPHLEAATRHMAGVARVHLDYAMALRAMGRMDEAWQVAQRALAISPEDATAWNFSGVLLQHAQRLDEEIACYRKATSLNAQYAEAYNNLGSGLLVQGYIAEAEQAYRTALALKPDWAGAHSNLVFALNYCSEDGAALREAHIAWARKHGAPLAPAQSSQKESSHRLRIGYVSADFRFHSVAFFIKSLLEQHDHTTFEVFCYADVKKPDEMTAQLKTYADHWRDSTSMSDPVLAELITADGIDILVDLAGHSGKNRLPVFARKPAPVQISWLGYPNTTGLKAIDYRITDAIADPPGMTEAFHTETLLRLPSGFLCYSPPPAAEFPVGPAPHVENGFITFGSFNLLAKITPEVVRSWSAILHETPRARLYLKARGLEGFGARTRLLSLFAAEGVGADRVSLNERTNSIGGHLEHYRQIDIALDPFPYNGTTTTCEALWMGVPLVTLAGKLHAGRVGASLLHRIGHPEWIARSHEEYVAIAAALAADPDRLTMLRGTLRNELSVSPLCDGPRFARDMEAAYRNMWHERCRMVT
jgi:predicted O-linked N-acetylglucosamine transferase (SPINDLY family)